MVVVVVGLQCFVVVATIDDGHNNSRRGGYPVVRVNEWWLCLGL